ncbi:MAG: rod shape-determining protein MreC [Verrucomicrobiales bacterium]
MRPINLLALLLFIGGLVWVITLSQPSVRQIQKTYYTAISPFLKAGSQAETHARAFIEEVQHSKDLEKKLERAHRERDRFKLIASRVRELEQENNELRTAVNFARQARFDIIPSRIVRRSPLTWSSTVTIDRGTEHGDLGMDQPVVAANGGLVGRVHNPVDSFSSVLLITDEASQVSAQVRGSPEKGIITGKLTSYGEKPVLRLLYLSKTAALTPGMMVYTDGRGKLFPPNIPIGKIISYNSGPEYGEALVDPVVDFNSLATVFVITRGTD